jgi:hypothetical protein
MNLQPLLQDKRIVILGAAVIFILMIIVVWLATGGGKVTLDIAVTPRDATVTIDGKASSAGKVQVAPGKHTIKASRQDFTEVTREIDTARMAPGTTIYMVLDPTNDSGRKYLTDHNDDQMLRERAFGQEFSDTQAQILDNYPITSDLPYETLEFKVDYEVDESKNVNFKVTIFVPSSTPDNQARVQAEYDAHKQQAIDWMRSKGVDTDKAKITYTQE